MISKDRKIVEASRHQQSYTSITTEGVIRSNTHCNTGYETYTNDVGWHCCPKPKKAVKRPEIKGLNSKLPRFPRGWNPNNKVVRKINLARKKIT